MRRRRLLAVTALAVATLASGCDVESSAPDVTESGPPPGAETRTALPGLPTPEQAREQLAALTVAEPRPMTGYSREKFPHWSSADGCTVRQNVLRRDGEQVRVDDDCQPVSGTWHSPYENETYTDPGDVDIDHMVPLANAWRSGADSWSGERREAFANDLTHPQLIAVGDSINRQKGDQAPDQWLPPDEAYWCTYALAWTGTKHAYGLTITADERDELDSLLDTCA